MLAREAVVTGLPSVSKEEAIRYVGNLLVERGHVGQSYVDAMVEREEKVSTFLGNGVAMPHGTFESKEAIVRSGIVVAQYPDGVDWGVGTAHIVIGLGAVGDDHVAILSHMAEILQDEDQAEALWDTTDQELLYKVLTTIPDEDDEDEDDAETGGPITRSVTIAGEGGLHARPASIIVEYAKGFDGAIVITKEEKSAKANSIMSVLALGAVANDTVEITVEGDNGAANAAAADEIERILTTPEEEL